MSRKATNEYIGTRRRAYAQADRAKRMRILDEVCETTGYERKYANRLLKPDVKAQLLAMSDRTMSRLLSGEARVKPGWAKGNK